MRSPEQVELELPVAGPTSRILAYAVDAVLMTLLFAVLVAVVVSTAPIGAWLLDLLERAANEISAEEPGQQGLGSYGFLLIALLVAGQLVIELSYFVFFETVWRGSSPGKRLLGLGVVADDGLPVSFGASLVRNLLRAVDMLPMSYLAGLVTMLVSERTRRLGDIAAGTVVIRFDRPGPASPLEVAADDAPHVAFTREQLGRVGATERRLLRQTLRRTDGMAGEEPERLAGRSARALAERLGADAPEPSAARAWLRALHAQLSRR